MPLDEQALMVEVGEAERAFGVVHALGAQPVLGRAQQQRGHLQVVYRLEARQAAIVPAVLFNPEPVDYRANPPHASASRKCDPQARLAEVHCRIAVGAQGLEFVGLHGRDPIAISGVELVGQIDELSEHLVVIDYLDFDLHNRAQLFKALSEKRCNYSIRNRKKN